MTSQPELGFGHQQCSVSTSRASHSGAGVPCLQREAGRALGLGRPVEQTQDQS